MSQTGDKDVLQQPEAGTRWLDLSIYPDNDGQFYMQHGLRGPLFTDILRQLKAFIDEYPQAKELIFLNLSHADYSDSSAQEVSTLTVSILSADRLLYEANDSGKSTFEFQSLASKTLAELTGSTTKLKVIGPVYPSPVTNTAGFV